MLPDRRVQPLGVLGDWRRRSEERDFMKILPVLIIALSPLIANCGNGSGSGREGDKCEVGADCEASLQCSWGECRHSDCPDRDCPEGWACIEGLCCTQSKCCGDEGPPGDVTCNNGEDDDCDGWTDDEDSNCGGECLSSTECDDGDPCTTDVCTSHKCDNKPVTPCCQADGTFEDAMNCPAAGDPSSITSGDFNNDGAPDLAVSINNFKQAGVFLANRPGGRPDGTFSAMTTYSAGDSPSAIVHGDFSGDGILDLAVSNIDSKDISLLLGHGSGGVGDGTFDSPISNDVGGSARGMLAADFNQDGHLDLAVASDDQHVVGVLLADPAGGFGPIANYAAADGTFWIAAADFNHDGALDLAAAAQSANKVSVLLGNSSGGKGDGTFAVAVDYGVGSGPVCVVAANLDSDEEPDLVVSNLDSGTVSVLLNIGDGSFGPKTDFGTGVGSKPRGIAVGDFNSDGILDLAVATAGKDGVQIFEGLGNQGQGTGTFVAGGEFATGGSSMGVTTGDFNADGMLDLAVSNSSGDTVSILLGKGACR